MDNIIPENTPLKQCSKCPNSYPATTEYFSRQKDGLRPACKVCMKAQGKAYYDAHTEKRKQYYQEHKEKMNKNSRQYHKEHREDILAKQRQSYQDNRDQMLKDMKRYRQDNKEEIAARKKKYYQEHKEQTLARNKAYRETHIEEFRERDRQYHQSHQEQRIAYAREYRIINRDLIAEKEKRRNERRHDKVRKYRQMNRKRILENERRYYQTEQGRLVARSKSQKRRARRRSAEGTFTAHDITNQIKRQRNRCYYCHTFFKEGRSSYHVDHVVPLSRGGSNSPDNLVIACPSCNTSKCDRLLHEWVRGGRLI